MFRPLLLVPVTNGSHGVKSNCFPQSMLKTFENRDDCILPPYYDDVIITLALSYECNH